MSYQYKTEKFEGPLELLLELIESEKMGINELSLAHIAGQYLDFIKNNSGINLEHLADFLSVASKLILIKSKTLLPLLQFSEEEEQEIKDLSKQLEEYKKFKDISVQLGKMAGLGRISYAREGFFGIKSIFYPPENINKFDLKKYFQIVLNDIPVIEKLEEEFVREVVSLEDKINELQNFLRHKIESSFNEIVSGAEEKIDVIIPFLAMLEMIKQRIINAEQTELFKEIKLKHQNANHSQ